VLERFADGAVYVACRLETGRTHQIRVHLSEAGHPLLGDTLYGGRAAARSPRINRQALHAATLGFEHPDGHALRFEAEPPADFAAALDDLRRGATWR
jgi:23S rRNA pseudouridine1911/1915/1917 synthase